LPAGTRRLLYAVAALTLLQVALGGWVSTNYAVLACSDFPSCQGSWWPEMDFRHGFTLLRDLGATRSGDFLPFAALTAIHYTHRLMAYAVFAALLWLAWRLHREQVAARRAVVALLGLALWQLASGLGNVVLGWPLVAALAHTAGAAVLVTLLVVLAVRGALAKLPERGDGRQPAGRSPAMR
jgi:cytochrome c oxidase assembly protein subunit 15